MRNIDAALKAKLLLAQKTLYNNADLKMRAIVSRPRSAISDKNFWREVIVSADVTATDTSTAIRRQHEGDLGDVAYVAQIVGTTLTVKRATITVVVTDMIWETVETIENCSNCALAFDGAFVRGSHFDVEYETDELPWLFYVTSTGQLMAGVLGEHYESLVGANVTAIDAVRGVASKYKDIDQGMLVFYTSAGSLYYKEYKNNEWGNQLLVSIAPSDVVKIRAERTFDYRIVLQITDSAGKLYEIFSKMEASGWNGQEGLLTMRQAYDFSISRTHVLYTTSVNTEDEYVKLASAEVTSARYSILTPEIRSVVNVPDGSLDYGFLVDFELDQIVYNAAANPDAFRLTDYNGLPWYGQEVISVTNRTIRVRFLNFNNATNPVTAEVLADRISNGYRLMDYDALAFTAVNIIPYPVVNPELVDIYNLNNRTIILTFDQNLVYISSTGFKVLGYEPEWSPEGVPVLNEYGIELIDYADPSIAADSVDLSSGTLTGLVVV